MTERPRAAEPVELDAALAWRESLALRLIRAFFGIYLVSAVVVAVSLTGERKRHVMIALSLSGAMWFGVPAVTGWPRGQARGWVILVPALGAAITGYASLGFLSGPGVSLAISLMLAGFLLGARVMIWLGIASALILTGVAWAMVHGWLPAPNPADVDMTRPLPWLRSLGVSFLGIGLFGGLMVAVLGRMERALRLARTETIRREHAERARAEAELLALESKQLEVVGQLAAGIAHDFNNNLTAIIGCAELLKQDLAERRAPVDVADEILHASKRAAELTRQLLVYSRKAQMVLEASDLHAVVQAAVGLARRSMDPNIEIVTELIAPEAIVLADKALLEGAVLNLLVNARDAMPKGGTLTIATRPHANTAGGQGSNEATPGVILEVRDTGVGIEKQLLSQIFDPFFTTKPVGKGTGLGLAAVAGTVKAHAGSISVESEINVGTTFRIWLPLAARDAALQGPSGKMVAHGSGEILLVDDELVVAATARRTLRSLGYEVTHVSDGASAIDLIGREPQRFKLVLLDLRMPGLSGEATFDRLREIAPSLPVVLWSGYRAGQDVEAMLQRGAAGFVEKPYTVVKLSQAIARAMASRAQSTAH
ncbi:MAG: response regulator [Myxococcota bacterium]